MPDSIPKEEFVKVEKVVEQVLIQNQQQELLYFSKILRHWEVIIGKPLARKALPEKLRKSTLVIVVEDAAYSHHLKFYEKHILDLIASPEICGDGAIRRIIFRVGKRREYVPTMEKLVPPPKPTIVDDPELMKENEAVSGRIKNKQLRRSFWDLMNKMTFKKTVD